MKNLSVTSGVLILFSVVACSAFLIGLLESKDFMFLAGMVMTYFFTKPADPSQPFGGK